MTLPLSLSRIWGKKFKKFKRGRKKGKEIRNVLNFTYRVHKRLCFLLPEKRPPHFLSTPLPYANPNLNPTHRGENRLTKSLQTCHHHVEQLPVSQNSKYPSLFQTNPRIIVHIRIYTRTYTRSIWKIRNPLARRGNGSLIHRFGKQLREKRAIRGWGKKQGSVITRCKKWGTGMEQGRVGRVAKSERKKLVFPVGSLGCRADFVRGIVKISCVSAYWTSN